jgi:hypothetical protein
VTHLVAGQLEVFVIVGKPLPTVSTPASRCGMCRKPPPTPTPGPRFATTGPGPAWTGTRPTLSPRSSPEPPGSRQPSHHPARPAGQCLTGGRRGAVLVPLPLPQPRSVSRPQKDFAIRTRPSARAPAWYPARRWPPRKEGSVVRDRLPTVLAWRRWTVGPVHVGG